MDWVGSYQSNWSIRQRRIDPLVGVRKCQHSRARIKYTACPCRATAIRHSKHLAGQSKFTDINHSGTVPPCIQELPVAGGH